MDLMSLTRTAATAPAHGEKIIMHGQPGGGKTTTWAYAPDVLFVPAVGEEAGIATLARNGLVPSTVRWLPEMPDSERGSAWTRFVNAVAAIASMENPPKWVVLDCFDDEGFLGAAYQHHCAEQYEGRFDTSGFLSFGVGYNTVIPTIKQVTHGLLDRMTQRGINVVLLCHTVVGTYKNPFGADFTKFQPAVQQSRIWPLLEGWANMVLFIDLPVMSVTKDGQVKGKGVGGTQRVVFTETSAVIVAKNRHGLPGQIELPADPSKAFTTIMEAISNGKSRR